MNPSNTSAASTFCHGRGRNCACHWSWSCNWVTGLSNETGVEAEYGAINTGQYDMIWGLDNVRMLLEPEVGWFVGSHTGEEWLPDEAKRCDNSVDNVIITSTCQDHRLCGVWQRLVEPGKLTLSLPSRCVLGCWVVGECRVVGWMDKQFQVLLGQDHCWFTSACNRWQWVGIVEEVSHPLSGLPVIINVIIITIFIIKVIKVIINSNDLKAL